LLRLIHAGRLAPLEELLAEIAGGSKAAAAKSAAGPRASAPATPAWSPGSEMANTAAAALASSRAAQMGPPTPASPPAFSAPVWRTAEPAKASAAASAFAAAAVPVYGDAPKTGEVAAERASESEVAAGHAATREGEPAADPAAKENPAVEGQTNGSPVLVASTGISGEQVTEIRGAIQGQQKFLGELLEHGHRWELDGAELRIFFATDKRPFAEMIEGRDPLEKIRAAASKVLNRPVRVCAKIESVAATATPASRVSDSQELRAKFERDPVVRSMLQRFGGKISEVKRREEGL